MQRSCRNNRNCQTSASTGAGHKGVSNLVIAAKHCYQFGLVHSTNGKHAGHCTPHNKQHVKTEDSNMDVSPQTPNTLQRLFPTQLSVRCFSPEGPKQAPGQHRSISAPRTGKHRRRRLRSISVFEPSDSAEPSVESTPLEVYTNSVDSGSPGGKDGEVGRRTKRGGEDVRKR